MRAKSRGRRVIAPLAPSCALVLALASAWSSSCVTIYEPGDALRKPAVIDPRLANFQGTRVFVRCKQPKRPDETILDRVIPNPLNNDGDALCQKVRTLFANQGADVETAVVRGDPSEARPTEGKPDLVIDLATRVLYDEENALLGVANCVSCTLVPTRQELRYAQTITVRDGDGALLKESEFKSRFVTFSGCGIWSVNYLLDVFFRDDQNDLIGDTPFDPDGAGRRDHSKDFYGQLSQLAFNARVRARLLQGAPLKLPPPPASAATSTPPTSTATPASTSTPLPSTPEAMPAPTAPPTPPTTPPTTTPSTASDTDYGY
jgi:hypothetical protein